MPDALEQSSASDADRPATPVVLVGDADNSKSTLIDRLLQDAGGLAEGSRDPGIDWPFLPDSSEAERDGSVGIRTARLPLTVGGRAFVIVDAPAHRQFVRNVVTASATAAVLVVDATGSVKEPTRRQLLVLRLLGVEHVVTLLDKVDLLGFGKSAIASAIGSLAGDLAADGVRAAATIPISSRDGDNVLQRSSRMGWYRGPTLADALDAVPPLRSRTGGAFRMLVQDEYRSGDRRMVIGWIEQGRIAIGDSVALATAPSPSRVASIETWPAPPPIAGTNGPSTALVLEPPIVVERGDILCDPTRRPTRASRVRTRLLWLRSEPLGEGECLRLRVAMAEYAVTVASIEHVVLVGDDLEAGAVQPRRVPSEGFAVIVLAATEEIVFDPFRAGSWSGRGVLADAGGRIVGGALLVEPVAISASQSIHPVPSSIAADERADRRGHRGGVFWMTGRPGAGKSTLAAQAERLLFDGGVDVAVLDGDTLRARLNGDLGFSDADRTENVRRTAAVARLMADAGLVVLVALISPSRAQREMAHALVGAFFHEVFVDADITTCERRDPKGHYAAARAGRLPGFTGVDGGYEAPERPALRIDTDRTTVEEGATALATFVRQRAAVATVALRAPDAAAMAEPLSRE